ncbi:MAG: hypothetical protein COB29_16265 [Sulfitobacter sp.]|nr:MAG: hypothetical protein COB29_16265 [Sulfitobacter sp.]
MLIMDAQVTGLGSQPLVSRNEFKQMHGALCALLSDIKVSIEKIMENEDWVSVLCTFTAKSPQTGKAVSISGSTRIRIGDGKLLEGYNTFDFLGLRAQLGFLPEDCFVLGLSGQKIV